MIDKFIKIIPSAFVMLLAGLFGALQADARLLPLTAEYFPDATVIRWLQDKYPSAISDGCVETDKVTDISSLVKLNSGQGNTYSETLEDLRCLRYFTKLWDGVAGGTLTIDYSQCPKLKYIDVSGLTGLTKITNNILYNSTTNSRYMMKAPVVELTADSCPNLKTVVFNNCPTLERISVKDCPALTEFYCGGNQYAQQQKKLNTVLKVIDLTGSPEIEQIWVSYNSALRELRLASTGRTFPTPPNATAPQSRASINLQCSYCALEELDLRNFYTLGNTAYTTTVNCQSNRLRSILFNEEVGHLYFQSLLLSNNALTDVNLPYEYDKSRGYSITTGTTNSSQKRNVGHEDMVVLSEAKMRGTFGKSFTGSVATTGGKTASGTPSTFTFTNAATTTGKYSYRPLGNAGVCEKVSFTCTLTRKKQMQMWVCGSFNGWTTDDSGVWQAPDDWDLYKQYWELEYAGNNNYKLEYKGMVEGDFRILVSDPNFTGTAATYWLGASHADLITPYTAVGAVDYSRKAAAEGDNRGYKLYDISSEPSATYDTFHYVSHVRNDGQPLRVIKDSPYSFSTHPCEAKGQTTAHVNPIFAVNFVSGDLTGGTPRNEAGNPDGGTVGVDGPASDADTDAPEMWFNLQGVRVDGTSPAPGIYIVRKGSKARKVLITE